jgi:hypothetical protein
VKGRVFSYNQAMPKREVQSKRWAAKLLFQFNVLIRGRAAKRRICEERIILLRAASPKSALSQAKKCGVAAEIGYTNGEGNPVRLEFIGVMDMLRLRPECGPDEVWYDIKQINEPMKRRRKFIPTDAWLLSKA